MDENLPLLEAEYCPMVDAALVHAIYSDYAGSADALDTARAVLDSIRRTALDEQPADFDPSGSSGDAFRSGTDRHGYHESSTESWASQTTPTETTNPSDDLAVSEGRSEYNSDEFSDRGYFNDIEHFDAPAKEQLLAETFPTLRFELVAFTLRKCDNDLTKATDELLNRVYFEDSQSSHTDKVVAKGIDAFAEDNNIPIRSKKGKARRKQRRANALGTFESDVTAAQPWNKWADFNREIDFITSRTKLSFASVSSVYHSNGAVISATISALLDKNIADQGTREPDATTVEHAVDLNAEFPTLDLDQAIALSRLTAPSTANAHELAKVLTGLAIPTTTSTGLTKIIPQYVPVNVPDSIPDSTIVPELPQSALPHTTTTLTAARREAFTQASAAYRKGKSNPLMKAVAGYYGQVGRDADANLKARRQIDADALVARQSSALQLDLHGVTVDNATRIAKAKVEAWWDELGEERIPGGGRRGAGDGFQIITGVGRHSEGGRGKLGPAVGKSLIAQGWKVEMGHGELRVTGKRR
ncbi:smr domain-containing protein [Polyplosphaeria fusca]|uniref:Smr domain-containing protein n=1 Tax=Polyplosphaeria fusca TaxID=682080 RepID=A0A9P4R0G0_9PLEO|nr:smr domain-containing protein [Polyplosphaeria fusca]